MKNITVYGKPNCPNCEKTKAWLEENGFGFDYYDVTLDQSALNIIKEHGYMELPVVSINDFEESWSGHSAPALVRLLWDGE
jgi:glutaredoxin-like protein NrdH